MFLRFRVRCLEADGAALTWHDTESPDACHKLCVFVLMLLWNRERALGRLYRDGRCRGDSRQWLGVAILKERECDNDDDEKDVEHF